MIHFEAGLAVIGAVVTVMGIFIAFEISFSAKMYYDLSDMIVDFVSSFKRGRKELVKKSRMIRKDMNIVIKEIARKTLIIFCGLVIIIGLITQVFFWEIDPQTNQIYDIKLLRELLVASFIWIGYFVIFHFYLLHVGRLTYLMFILEKKEKAET